MTPSNAKIEERHKHHDESGRVSGFSVILDVVLVWGWGGGFEILQSYCVHLASEMENSKSIDVLTIK